MEQVLLIKVQSLILEPLPSHISLPRLFQLERLFKEFNKTAKLQSMPDRQQCVHFCYEEQKSLKDVTKPSN